VVSGLKGVECGNAAGTVGQLVENCQVVCKVIVVMCSLLCLLLRWLVVLLSAACTHIYKQRYSNSCASFTAPMQTAAAL
jgi:hypothetical protein